MEELVSWEMGVMVLLISGLAGLLVKFIVTAFNKIIDRLDTLEKQMEVTTGINTVIMNHLSDDEKFARSLDRFYNTINAAKG